jgi:hypothetical protein
MTTGYVLVSEWELQPTGFNGELSHFEQLIPTVKRVIAG